MGVRDHILWKILERKAAEEDRDRPGKDPIANTYLAGVEKIIQFGLKRSRFITLTFPLYTLHDETHICNVLKLMAQLLGPRVEELNRDEAAMLILAACCHDIGMSYSKEEQEELVPTSQKLNDYLNSHPGEYLAAYPHGGDKPELSPELRQRFFRSIHHERIRDILGKMEWPEILEGRLDREDLIRVCKSHGEDSRSLESLDRVGRIDLRMCAVLLRLADILDFDASRAPRVLYRELGFSESGPETDAEKEKSRGEWNKHWQSKGFEFEDVDRSYPYSLGYRAVCKDIGTEQAVRRYLDWVDLELESCRYQLSRFQGRWQSLVLPSKLYREIKSEEYCSGEYRLAMDQRQILELLAGENLYREPGVFVRELLQNAIDAVRTRQRMDRALPANWKPQIHIRSWIDEEGFQWFRIEDNGIGMTEEAIRKYFLNVGVSYYQSEEFLRDKLKCGVEDYQPVSRFGVGILSCFLGNQGENRVYVSTRAFARDGKTCPALRLEMPGLGGYYSLASEEKGHRPGPAPGVTEEERRAYLPEAGTVVTVRTNLYQVSKYLGFLELVDQYVVFPEAEVHYRGPDGCVDYPTERDLMEAVHRIRPHKDLKKLGRLEFPFPQEVIDQLRGDFPQIPLSDKPKLVLRIVPVDRFTESPHLTGVVWEIAVEGVPEYYEWKKRRQTCTVSYHLLPCFDSRTGNVGLVIHNVRMDNEYDWKPFPIPDDGKGHVGYFLGTLGEEASALLELLESAEKRLNAESWKTVLTAHNGVFLESSGLMLTQWKKCHGIFLLKDQYRPELGLSRDEVRRYPLEAACDLTATASWISSEGYGRDICLPTDFTETYLPVTLLEYRALFDRRPDLLDKLRISFQEDGGAETGKKIYSMREAKQHFSSLRDGKMVVKLKLGNSTPKGEQKGILLWNLQLAALRESFTLAARVGFLRYTEVILTRNRPDPQDHLLLNFPPSMFLHVPAKNCPVVLESFLTDVPLYNVDHPFFQWLFQNQEELRRNRRGILEEILRCLLWKSSDVPNKMKQLLERLEASPQGTVTVPDEIYSIVQQDFHL